MWLEIAVYCVSVVVFFYLGLIFGVNWREGMVRHLLDRVYQRGFQAGRVSSLYRRDSGLSSDDYDDFQVLGIGRPMPGEKT